MDWDEMNNFLKSDKSYLGLYSFRLNVTNYMINEYDIPNIFDMKCTEATAKFINSTMVDEYNKNNSVGNTAKIFADYLKGSTNDTR